MRINNKLALIFLLIGIFSGVTVGIYSYYSAKNALVSRTFDQLKSLKGVKKKQIEGFFADRFREIKLFSQTEDVNKLLKILTKSSLHLNKDFTPFEYNRYFNRYIQSCGYYDKFIVCDTTGRMIYSDVSESKPEFNFVLDTIKNGLLNNVFKKTITTKQTVIQDYQNDKYDNNKPVSYIASPIDNDKGEIVGVIALQISLGSINKIMLENSNQNGLGNTGETYLVGNDYLMRSCSRFKEQSVLKTKVKTIASVNAFNKIDSTEIIKDYRNIAVLSSYNQLNIPGLNWVIIVEIDLDEAMKPVNAIRNDILFLSIVLIFFIFGFALFIARTISLPIIKLRNATIKVGEGDFDTKVSIKSTDEIGELAATFNKMTYRLQTITEVLKEREEHLSHFYEATLDGIVLHENGKMVLFNKALAVITGYGQEELNNKKIQELIDIKENPLKNDHQKVFSYETICNRKGGMKFPVEIQESNIDFKGRIIIATVIRDISQRKNVENELKSEREKRLSALIDGQELERQRFSRELHDGLGQQLIAMKLKFENTINQNWEETKKNLFVLLDQFDKIIDEVRRISENLMPSILKEFGLDNALKTLSKAFSQLSGIKVNYDSIGMFDKIDDKTKTYLYRISQEALNNIIKHAAATEINIQLIELSGNLRLIIEDNGKGFIFNDNFVSEGNGIYHMKERVNLINGLISIDSTLGKGTIITIKVKINT